MKQSNVNELTCNRWLAKIRLPGGDDVLVHIHRGSPINAKDAMKVARNTAKFGKVGTLLPVGQCGHFSDDED